MTGSGAVCRCVHAVRSRFVRCAALPRIYRPTIRRAPGNAAPMAWPCASKTFGSYADIATAQPEKLAPALSATRPPSVAPVVA